MIKEIESRRSIRRYKDIPVKKELIEEILKAGMLAPSSKNRQPWHFIVTTGSAKEQVLKAMEAGLKREEKQPFLPESAPYLDGARATLKIMKEAPVIFLSQTLWPLLWISLWLLMNVCQKYAMPSPWELPLKT